MRRTGEAQNKAQRWIEFAALYVGLPVAVAFWFPSWSALPVLWGGAGLAWWLLWRAKKFGANETPLLLCDEVQTLTRRALPIVLARFVVGAMALTGLLLWLHPEWLLVFPRRDPLLCGIVLVAYPVLSVFPQVVVYRLLFMRRYSSLFEYKPLAWLVGAAVFSLAHLTFGNPPAMIFTFIGGLVFIRTYQKTRSVWLNALEHSLYGDFLFVIGWGECFFHGGTQALLMRG